MKKFFKEWIGIFVIVFYFFSFVPTRSKASEVIIVPGDKDSWTESSLVIPELGYPGHLGRWAPCTGCVSTGRPSTSVKLSEKSAVGKYSIEYSDTAAPGPTTWAGPTLVSPGNWRKTPIGVEYTGYFRCLETINFKIFVEPLEGYVGPPTGAHYELLVLRFWTQTDSPIPQVTRLLIRDIPKGVWVSYSFPIKDLLADTSGLVYMIAFAGYYRLNTITARIDELYFTQSACEADGCNGNCPYCCTVNEDPDCYCLDDNDCCGIGCTVVNDNDCSKAPPPPSCGNGALDAGEECDPPFDAACKGQCQANCTCPLSSPPGPATNLINPFICKDIPCVIEAITNFIFYVSIALVPLMIIIGAVMLITAAGNPNRVTTAKRLFFWTAIGVAIILLAKVLMSVIKNILGGG